MCHGCFVALVQHALIKRRRCEWHVATTNYAFVVAVCDTETWTTARAVTQGPVKWGGHSLSVLWDLDSFVENWQPVQTTQYSQEQSLSVKQVRSEQGTKHQVDQVGFKKKLKNLQ